MKEIKKSRKTPEFGADATKKNKMVDFTFIENTDQ